MAVPANGPFSIGDIWREASYNNPYSLQGPPYAESAPRSLAALSNPFPDYINTNNPASNRPDRVAPHAMSEFRGYDQDAQPPYTVVSINLYRTIGGPEEACGGIPNYPVYYNGTQYNNWYQAVLYENSDFSTPVGGGYWFGDGGSIVAFYDGDGNWQPSQPCTDFGGGGGDPLPPPPDKGIR